MKQRRSNIWGSWPGCLRFDALTRQEFSCEADALQALECYRESCQVLEVHDASVSKVKHYQGRGRPATSAAPERVGYRLTGTPAASVTVFQERVERGARFILATNDVGNEKLSAAEVLSAYKEQSKVERGFRFLKPMFCANTLYLKKPERIMALLMVMTVCLLVYAALEHRIRQALAKSGATVPDQTNLPKTPCQVGIRVLGRAAIIHHRKRAAGADYEPR